MSDSFHVFANRTSAAVGSPRAFIVALLVVVAWGVTGPLFRYSDTWQLVINTSTTIVTFLMVFLIQNTQNRDARAMHLKLDELIRAVEGARNYFVDIESLADADIASLQTEFVRLHAQYGDALAPAAEQLAEVAEARKAGDPASRAPARKHRHPAPPKHAK